MSLPIPNPGAGFSGFRTVTDVGQPQAVTFDATTNLLTVSSAFTVPGGHRVVFTTTGGLAGGLTAGTIYYLPVKAAATTSLIYATQADSIAGTSPIDITSSGTGTHTMTLAGATYMPAARFMTLPSESRLPLFESLTTSLNIYVAAFHMNGIASVDISIDAGTSTVITAPVRDFSTGSTSAACKMGLYGFTIDPSLFSDGRHVARIIVTPQYAGKARGLQSSGNNDYGDGDLIFYTNTGGTLTNGTAIHATNVDGNLPRQLLFARVLATGNCGGSIVKLATGTYNDSDFKSAIFPGGYTYGQDDRWIIFEPEDGASVTIVGDGANSNCVINTDVDGVSKVMFRNLTVSAGCAFYGSSSAVPHIAFVGCTRSIAGAAQSTEQAYGYFKNDHCNSGARPYYHTGIGSNIMILGATVTNVTEDVINMGGGIFADVTYAFSTGGEDGHFDIATSTNATANNRIMLNVGGVGDAQGYYKDYVSDSAFINTKCKLATDPPGLFNDNTAVFADHIIVAHCNINQRWVMGGADDNTAADARGYIDIRNSILWRFTPPGADARLRPKVRVDGSHLIDTTSAGSGIGADFTSTGGSFATVYEDYSTNDQTPSGVIPTCIPLVPFDSTYVPRSETATAPGAFAGGGEAGGGGGDQLSTPVLGTATVNGHSVLFTAENTYPNSPTGGGVINPDGYALQIQRDSDPAFPSPVTVDWEGTGVDPPESLIYVIINSQPNGTWYYRVKWLPADGTQTASEYAVTNPVTIADAAGGAGVGKGFLAAPPPGLRRRK